MAKAPAGPQNTSGVRSWSAGGWRPEREQEGEGGGLTLCGAHYGDCFFYLFQLDGTVLEMVFNKAGLNV